MLHVPRCLACLWYGKTAPYHDSRLCCVPRRNGLQLTDLTFKGKKLYSTNEALALQSMWRSLVDTTNVLRNIMTSNTLPSVTTASLHSPTDVRDPSTSALTTHISRHLELHQLTAATAVARARNERKELENAIDGAIAFMEAMINDGTVNFASPVTVPLATPDMIGCLETARVQGLREDSGKSRSIDTKLDAISNFLFALESNYPAASIISRVLKTARDEIWKMRSQPRVEPDHLSCRD
jgi:hypothetical protein